MYASQLANADQILARLMKAAVGYDHLLRQPKLTIQNEKFPPYNIISTSENDYEISIAVAGYRHNELSITEENGVLTVEGRKQPVENDTRCFHVRGIAERNFKHIFELAEHLETINADIVDGILTIKLKRNLPDSKKPKKIAIGTVDQPKIESV